MQPRRQRCGIHGVIDEVRKFIVEPRGLVFLDPRQHLFACVKPQPGVEQVPLLDRFDDRWVGAFEIHGCNPFSICITIKTPNHRAEGEIFDESAGMRRNTVNVGFPAG